MMLLKENFQGKLKSMTSRRFFGSYFHSICIHSPQQYRIISGRSSNTEKEEANFSIIKKATNLTSNHHPDNIILNAILLNLLNTRDILDDTTTPDEKITTTSSSCNDSNPISFLNQAPSENSCEQIDFLSIQSNISPNIYCTNITIFRRNCFNLNLKPFIF